ncbi:MAG: hypothetical protein K2R98_01245 [Gemmataceae bacterium]|nr:hypothetical protein [Gemmataceae bacterium]
MSQRSLVGLAGFVSFCLLAAQASAVQAQGAKAKPPTWVWAMDVKVRSGGNADFSKALKFGIEVWKDEQTGTLVYICENGNLATIPGANASVAANAKAPTWVWGLDLKARLGGADGFNNSRKYGVEVYKDENSGNLVYVSETGSIAVMPGGNAATGKPKPPTWVWGLDLKARVGGTDDFDKARKFGVEVFKDENAGNLVYICETGALAVISGPQAAPVAKVKPPVWTAGLDLKARVAGIDAFERARKYGIEVYKDENGSNVVYICETGCPTVMPAR